MKCKISQLICVGLIAAVASVGCKSAQEDDSGIVYLDNEHVESILTANDTKLEAFADLQPGVVYVQKKLEDRFSLREKNYIMETDREGVLLVRVMGQTEELPFFEWLVFPGRPYKLSYRFVWFDNNGKIVATPGDCQDRTTMPGDSVRFTAKANNINCKKFCFIVGYQMEKTEAPVAEPISKEKTSQEKAPGAKVPEKK